MSGIGRSRNLLGAVVGLSLCATGSIALAAKVGQSISVQYGLVTGGKVVDLNSSAVPAGALIGGTLGVASASGKSSGKKVRNALIGGAAGAVIAGAAQGSQKGMLYEVDVGAGATVQVVTDQREIRPGDCVAVERADQTTNLRRVTMAYCDVNNQNAVAAVADESREEAAECLAAKQQLVDAATTEAADLAARKISLLCDD